MNSYALLSVLLLCLFCQRSAVSFIAPSSTTRKLFHGEINGNELLLTSINPTSLHATSLSSPDQTKIDAEETSSDLLRILQTKAATKSKEDADLDAQINSLVQTLIASKSKFDPAKSIDGPLFASVHFTGSDTPLWEKIGSASGVQNIKGQKYTLFDGSTTEGNFVNYAEIFGGNFHLKAVGTFRDEGPSSLPESDETVSSSNNPLEAFTSLFNSGNNNNLQSSQLLPTPYDYSATVTGASVVLFQKYSLDLTIEGTGTVRVLYADENLRIFLSPTDTNVTKGAGDWESEGLVVVQVRVDLVFDDWTDGL
mmetsp:Transcript_7231/g.12771  ORF Transcript_7231/g.12771 Transcript_7231/m.12771 type:complete len:310 (-) Transcript_7231:283-1212(-)